LPSQVNTISQVVSHLEDNFPTVTPLLANLNHPVPPSHPEISSHSARVDIISSQPKINNLTCTDTKDVLRTARPLAQATPPTPQQSSLPVARATSLQSPPCPSKSSYPPPFYQAPCIGINKIRSQCAVNPCDDSSQNISGTCHVLAGSLLSESEISFMSSSTTSAVSPLLDIPPLSLSCPSTAPPSLPTFNLASTPSKNETPHSVKSSLYLSPGPTTQILSPQKDLQVGESPSCKMVPVEESPEIPISRVVQSSLPVQESTEIPSRVVQSSLPVEESTEIPSRVVPSSLPVQESTEITSIVVQSSLPVENCPENPPSIVVQSSLQAGKSPEIPSIVVQSSVPVDDSTKIPSTVVQSSITPVHPPGEPVSTAPSNFDQKELARLNKVSIQEQPQKPVQSVLPTKYFLLPLKENWSIYMKKVVEEMMYKPRTVECRKIVIKENVADQRQSLVASKQSRLSLLNKLRSVGVVDSSTQGHRSINSETTPLSCSFRSPPPSASCLRALATSPKTRPSSLNTGTQADKRQMQTTESHPLPPCSNPLLVQGHLAQDEVFLMLLEHKHGVVVHDVEQSDDLPHLLVGPVEGVFVFWPGVVMPTQPPERCYAASCNMFQKLWFICVSVLDIYEECCKLSYWSCKTVPGCKLLPAMVADRQHLAQFIADIVHSQTRSWHPKQISENSSNHQKLLLNMFPCLNAYSVKVILARVNLLQFLSLDKASIINLFPWLPESSAADIADITGKTFQLSQFINYNRVGLGHTVTRTCYMDKTVREAEVNKIMGGL